MLYFVTEIKSASHQDLSRLESAASFCSESDDDDNLSRHASPAPSNSTSREGKYQLASFLHDDTDGVDSYNIYYLLMVLLTIRASEFTVTATTTTTTTTGKTR